LPELTSDNDVPHGQKTARLPNRSALVIDDITVILGQPDKIDNEVTSDLSL